MMFIVLLDPLSVAPFTPTFPLHSLSTIDTCMPCPAAIFRRISLQRVGKTCFSIDLFVSNSRSGTTPHCTSPEIQDDDGRGELELRPGRFSDLEDLVTLSSTSFQEESIVKSIASSLGLWDFSGNIRKGLETRLNQIISAGDGCNASRYAMIVASDAQTGRVVGMVEMGLLPCPVPLSRRPAPELPYLVNLAVLKEYRRRGIGQQLVRACEHKASEEWGYREIFLYVKAQNRVAQALYSAMGYTCEWREPSWYRLKSGLQKLQSNPRLFLRKELLPDIEDRR